MLNLNRLIIVAGIAMSSLAVQAQAMDFTEGNYPPAVQSQSSLTREQVKAEMLQARQRGEAALVQGDSMHFPATRSAVSQLSREQVRQEAVAAARAGDLNYGG